MLRFNGLPAMSFVAIVLVLCIMGLINYDDNVNDYSRHRSDRADSPLLANRYEYQRGLKYLRSPTGTSPTPPLSTGSSCNDPPLGVPFSLGEVNQLCQCEPNHYAEDYNSGWYSGNTRCHTTCVPRYSNLTRIVDANESFSECILACTGSFEKAKRAMVEGRSLEPGYWFCHAVNFIKGELCEFIGEIGYYDFPTPGVQCWDLGITD